MQTIRAKTSSSRLARIAQHARPLLLSGALCIAASELSGQSGAPATRLDEGSFTIIAGGQRVGREQFSIQARSDAEGTVLELRSESSRGELHTALRLEADSAGTPIRYSLEQRQGAEETLKLGGQRVRGRFTTLSRSLTGESAREYLLRPGTVLLEEDGVVQYALLVRLPLAEPEDAITLPSLAPAANSQGPVRIVLESISDTVSIARVRRAARRWRVVSSSSEVRLVWADPDGRLLRMTIPSRGLEALRDDVPP